MPEAAGSQIKVNAHGWCSEKDVCRAQPMGSRQQRSTLFALLGGVNDSGGQVIFEYFVTRGALLMKFLVSLLKVR